MKCGEVFTDSAAIFNSKVKTIERSRDLDWRDRKVICACIMYKRGTCAKVDWSRGVGVRRGGDAELAVAVEPPAQYPAAVQHSTRMPIACSEGCGSGGACGIRAEEDYCHQIGSDVQQHIVTRSRPGKRNPSYQQF